MGIDLERYNELKDHADKAQREADKQKGVLEELKAQLKRDFGVSTLKAAKAKLKQFQEEQDDAERTYEQALAQFLEDYPEFEEEA